MTKETVLKIAHLTGAIQMLDRVIQAQSDLDSKLQQQREDLVSKMTGESMLKVAQLHGATQMLDQMIRVQSDFTGKLQQQREKLQQQVNDLQEVDK